MEPNWVRTRIIKVLDTRISPLTYATACLSWAIGMFFGVLEFLPDIQHSFLEHYGLLGDTRYWGLALMAAATILLVGLAVHRRDVARIGAMGGFLLWVYAGIIYLSHKYWFLFFTVAVFNIVCQGYFYLVAAIDTLWEGRYTKD